MPPKTSFLDWITLDWITGIYCFAYFWRSIRLGMGGVHTHVTLPATINTNRNQASAHDGHKPLTLTKDQSETNTLLVVLDP